MRITYATWSDAVTSAAALFRATNPVSEGALRTANSSLSELVDDLDREQKAWLAICLWFSQPLDVHVMAGIASVPRCLPCEEGPWLDRDFAAAGRRVLDTPHLDDRSRRHMVAALAHFGRIYGTGTTELRETLEGESNLAVRDFGDVTSSWQLYLDRAATHFAGTASVSPGEFVDRLGTVEFAPGLQFAPWGEVGEVRARLIAAFGHPRYWTDQLAPTVGPLACLVLESMERSETVADWAGMLSEHPGLTDDDKRATRLLVTDLLVARVCEAITPNLFAPLHVDDIDWRVASFAQELGATPDGAGVRLSMLAARADRRVLALRTREIDGE